jgi:putative cardiolipin synthase
MSRALPSASAWLAALLLPGLLAGCDRLPPLGERAESSVLSPEEARRTPLGRVIAPMAQRHPDRSGFVTLTDSRAALAARLRLIRAAEKTLDVRYYIWRDDRAGRLMLDALHDAARRGVRVRLLLDDNGLDGLDATLAALDTHPRFQVRLFNPFTFRELKSLEFLVDLPRLNHRMHNKSLTADEQVTISGGRNIGDEYFGAAEGRLFADLDILAVGPVVRTMAEDFDRYWASESAYPAATVLPAAAGRQGRPGEVPRAGPYAEALAEPGPVTRLLAGEAELEWAPMQLVSDDPAKGLGRAEPDGLITRQLLTRMGEPEERLDLIAPYFVPTRTGVTTLGGLVERGVRVRVLTNSLAATDVALVHAGYAKYRKAALAAGITLFEMRPLDDRPEGEMRPGPLGSSGSSLHAKTFAIDGKRVFVGTFNFDPRSANLNTEMGFIIDSPALAERIHAAFRDTIPESAWRVGRDADGLYWLEGGPDGATTRHRTEPHSGLWERLLMTIIAWLPVDWLL